MFKQNIYAILLVLSLCFGAVTAHADESSDWGFAGSGFLTVGAGMMLGGHARTSTDKQCPCFIADYAQKCHLR